MLQRIMHSPTWPTFRPVCEFAHCLDLCVNHNTIRSLWFEGRFEESSEDGQADSVSFELVVRLVAQSKVKNISFHIDSPMIANDQIDAVVNIFT